jgi:hypothetical protein
MKIRVWGYRDGTILPDGFERDVDVVVTPGYLKAKKIGRLAEALAQALAERDAVVALAESVGVEVCLDDDGPGSAAHAADVEQWLGIRA